MDKELIVEIVGNLYLTNQLLTRRLEEANKELDRLRLLVEEFGVELNGK